MTFHKNLIFKKRHKFFLNFAVLYFQKFEKGLDPFMKYMKKILSLALIVLILNLNIVPEITPLGNDRFPIEITDIGGGFDGSDK